MRTTTKARILEFTRNGWWGEETLSTLFEKAAAKGPSQPALIDQYNRSEFTDGSAMRLTYAELARIVDDLSATFFERGLRRDDIVLIQLPNIAELPIVFLALAKLGAIASPMPTQYGKIEIAHAKEQLGPKGFVTTRHFKERRLADEALGLLGDDCKVFSFGKDVPAGAIALDTSGTGCDDPEPWSQYTSSGEPSANDIFTICWTSGTTGQPKGVPRSHNHWISSATGAHDAADMQDHESILNPFPMVNMAAISGFLYPWLMRTATLVLHHPLDLEVFLKQLETEKVAYTIAPPAVLNMMLKKRELLDAMDLSNIRVIASGSAPLSTYMVEGYRQHYGIDIVNMFGSNEGVCLVSAPQDVPAARDRAAFFPRFGAEDFTWSNRAAATVRTRIVDMESREVITEPRRPGELEIWGGTVFDGYWKSPEANEQVFTADGYFRTGDVFEIAGDGNRARLYRFVGRCKDIIIRGGMNISPDEIDNLLAGHPKIAEVAVVGYDDDALGERVGAAVVPKTGDTVSLEDLTDFLRKQGLAIFKHPERLLIVEEIPRNALGKVLRRKLKSSFDSSTTAD